MMDSQDSHHPQAQFHHPQPPQSGHSMMAAPQHHSNSYGMPNNAMMQQQQSIQQQQQNPRFPFNSMMGSGSVQTVQPPTAVEYADGSSQRTAGFGIEPTTKKKRGRPRKYSPDGGIALALSPAPVSPISSMAGHGDSGGGTGTSSAAPNNSSENQPKKARGRPPGSGKRQLDAVGSTGIGFTPHVITVQAGEDVAKKITTFSQLGPRTVCILSASGSICNVTLRQPAACGGAVTLEGRFEILSLSGSFSPSDSNGNSRTCGLSVSLAGADGKVVGGGIAGMLTAAGPVQVIVGSFIADGKKRKYKRSSSSTPPSSNIVGAPQVMAGSSPPSEDDGSSESSEENGASPLNHHQQQEQQHHGPPPAYGNNVTQPIQSLPMYGNMGWPNSTM
ncbi:unnamed protein product [Cuscuta epithymum]|uniref:AT-hook motif nuclear-localized protein n=1 Tax=Cuscuta epithymum TaxID=186058 RepID=A0AAV0FFS9_9ASTE|nr:unnamed protein product [Cuscuta epithymum]